MTSSGEAPLLPGGVRDRLGGEARALRQAQERLLRLFATWGYQEVMTPVFEFLEVFDDQRGFPRENLYKFFDQRGRILALRADMTMPVARLAATRLRHEALPLRLGYAATVYRQKGEGRGESHEINQAGAELIGLGSPLGEAEILGLAVEAIQALEIEDYYLSLGHMGLFQGLAAEADLNAGEIALLQEALANRDFVAYGQVLAQIAKAGRRTRELKELPFWRGQPEEVLKKAQERCANERGRQALEELQGILARLYQLKPEARVLLDLGLLRRPAYYTGLVFEGYAQGLGWPILGGGRYDDLLSSFGFQAPAVGFGFLLDGVLPILQTRTLAKLDYLLLASPSNWGRAGAKAGSLRQRGFSVVVFETTLSLDETNLALPPEVEKFLRAHRPEKVLYYGDAGIRDLSGSLVLDRPGERAAGRELPTLAVEGIH